jgi:hypothetical protein
MEKNIREEGFYWIKDKDEWYIAERNNNEWYLTGDEVSKSDKEFNEWGYIVMDKINPPIQ